VELAAGSEPRAIEIHASVTLTFEVAAAAPVKN
jgi:hypothetical protein